MSHRTKFTTIALFLLLAISLSINFVFAVNQGAEPGSDSDPIVSKSYVDQIVNKLNQQIQSLAEQNTALSNKLAAQEATIKKLQDEISKGAASGTNTGTGSNTGTNAGAGTGTGANAGTTAGTNNGTGTGTGANTGTKPAANTGTNTGSSTAPAKKGIVNTAALNVRKEANTSSAKLTQLTKNSTVTILSKSNGWYKITTANGITGYVLGTYITEVAASTGTPSGTGSAAANKKGVVNVAALNVRKEASATATKLAQLVKGNTVTILSQGNGWYKITTASGITGYVMASYITVQS